MKPISVSGQHLDSECDMNRSSSEMTLTTNEGEDVSAKMTKTKATRMSDVNEVEEFKPEEEDDKEGRNGSCIVSPEVWMLPDEVLTIIFDNLETPKDLSSISQACHRFKRIVNQQKQWRILQALPHILPHLSKRDILKCRLISPAWCQRVDFTLQTNCRPQPWKSPDLEHLTKSLQAKQFLPLRLTSIPAVALKDSTLEQQSRRGDPEERNPFVTRWITLEYTGSFAQSYWCRASLFLHKFGHFLWHLNLNMSPILYDSLEKPEVPQYYQVYEILVDILSMTPNLKSLELQFSQITAKSDIHPDNKFFLSYLQKKPIPVSKLTKLESLYLTGGPRYIPIQASVLKQLGGQLKKIVIGGKLESSLETLFGCGGEGLSFDQLKDLSLKMTDAESAIKVLRTTNAPELRKLGLDLEVKKNPRILEAFNVLKRFPVLECLLWHVEVNGLSGGIGGYPNNGSGPLEPLTGLRFLELCNLEGLPYNKLFRRMPVLEEVTIFGRKKDRSKEPDGVDKVMELGRSQKFWMDVAGRKLERFKVKEWPGVKGYLLVARKVIVGGRAGGGGGGKGTKAKILIYE